MTCDGECNKKKYWISVIIVLLILAIIVAAIIGDIVFNPKKESKKYSKIIDNVDENQFMDQIQEYIDVQSDYIDYLKQFSKIKTFAQSEICAEVGKTILIQNGSAVDAGIAMIFCQGVVEPYNSGLGGGFLMLIYIHEDKKIVTLDARETATSAMTREILRSCNGTGWLSVATPGEGLGLWEAHKKYGKLSWKMLLQPSIQLASNGFPFSKTMAKFLDVKKIQMISNTSLLEIFLNPTTQKFYTEGENYVNPTLAELLTNISKAGLHSLYFGEVADKIEARSLASDGIIKKKDFEEYRIKWSNTLTSNLEDCNNDTFTVHIPPLPSYAIMIPMILNIVQWYYHDKTYHPEVPSTEEELFYHQVVESMKHTFAAKEKLDDKFSLTEYDIYNFLSKHWGLRMREKLNLTHTVFPDSLIPVKNISEFASENPEAEQIFQMSSTNIYGATNVAAIASNGDAIVACCSLNDPFGSGVVTHGFVLNNNMVNFLNQVKDRHKRFDDNLTQLLYNNRSTTFHSPMMVLDDEDELKLVLSAYGDSRVITSMSLVLINYFLANDTLKEAVVKFRYHHELTSGILIYEGPTMKFALEYLFYYGHAVKMINGTSQWPWMLVLGYKDEDLATFGDPRRNY